MYQKLGTCRSDNPPLKQNYRMALEIGSGGSTPPLTLMTKTS